MQFQQVPTNRFFEQIQRNKMFKMIVQFQFHPTYTQYPVVMLCNDHFYKPNISTFINAICDLITPLLI